MSLMRYLILMIIGTLLCWLAWVLIIIQINPLETGVLGFTFFYLSLFLSLVGTLAIGGFLLRILIYQQKEPYFRQVKKSFRHSLFFALLLIIALILQSQGSLNWWNVLILLSALIFFELYFLTNRNSLSR